MPLELSTKQSASFDADGFVVIDKIIDPVKIPVLHQTFKDLFCGVFETSVCPDEINWQQGESNPNLSRQICNG